MLKQLPPDAGAVLLSNCGVEYLTISCKPCNRIGRYAVARLIEQFGPHAGLPDVKVELAKCPKAKNQFYDRCQVVFDKPVW